MPSLTPDLGLDLSMIQAEVVAHIGSFQTWSPTLPDLTQSVVGVPLWMFAPAVLAAIALMFGVSALPWRAADRAPLATERRHGDLAVGLVSLALLISIGTAQGFIVAAQTLLPSA